MKIVNYTKKHPKIFQKSRIKVWSLEKSDHGPLQGWLDNFQKCVSHNIGESYIIWPHLVWVSRSHMIKPLLTFLSFWILSFMLCCGRSDISNPFSAGQLLLHVAAKQTNRTLTPWAANLLCLVSPYQQMQPDLTPCFFHCYSIVSIPTHYPDFCLYKLVLLECSTDPQLLHFASHL